MKLKPIHKKKVARKKVARKKKVVSRSKKRKPSEKRVLNAIKKAEQVQRKHMSGFGVKNQVSQDYKNTLEKIDRVERWIIGSSRILKESKNPTTKSNVRAVIKEYKKALKEYKTHARELKKLL